MVQTQVDDHSTQEERGSVHPVEGATSELGEIEHRWDIQGRSWWCWLWENIQVRVLLSHRYCICSSFQAELWGILTGLKLAWDWGYRRVISESDAAAVVTLLTHRSHGQNHPNSLVRDISAWLRKEWEITVSHTLRTQEGNRWVDWLAGVSLNLSLGLHVWQFPPHGVNANYSWWLSGDFFTPLYFCFLLVFLFGLRPR